MYTGTIIEDLIQCVEAVEQRTRATAHKAVDMAPAPLVQPAYEMNWQDWQEMVEVA